MLFAATFPGHCRYALVDRFPGGTAGRDIILLRNTNFADALSETSLPRAETRFVTPHARSSMPHPVHDIFASVLRVPVGSISDETSPENTPTWDSLQSINLVLALEEEFGVTLGTRDIAEMRSVGLVKAVLRRKGATGV